MSTKKSHTWHTFKFVICGSVIFLFIVFAIYPNQMSLIRMDREVEALSTRIEEQQIMSPLFDELMKLSQKKDPDMLPFPKREKVKRSEIGNVSLTLKKFSEESNLTVGEITPDVNTLVDDSGYVKMVLKVRGQFSDFRNFLLKIGELPYVDHIEQIQIRTVPDTETYELGLKVWLTKQ